MILVTVGTHEDPMNRLLEAVDACVARGDIREPVIAQSGYSTYAPRRFEAHAQVGFEQLQAWMREARIILTHGGPATIMQAFSHGKVPIVVPRQAAFGEHVDDHQVRFCRRLADRAIVVEDIATLPAVLASYDEVAARLAAASGTGTERAAAFSVALEEIVTRVVSEAPRRALRTILRRAVLGA